MNGDKDNLAKTEVVLKDSEGLVVIGKTTDASVDSGSAEANSDEASSNETPSVSDTAVDSDLVEKITEIGRVHNGTASPKKSTPEVNFTSVEDCFKLSEPNKTDCVLYFARKVREE